MQGLSQPYVDWGIVLMDKIKLKWKIFIFLLVFCSILLFILWLFQTVFLNDMYKMVRKKEIRQAITLVEDNINSDDLTSIFAQLEIEKSIFVTPTTGFVAPSEPMPNDRGERPRPETLTQVKEFTLQDGQTVSLTFHAMITPVNATVSTLQMQLYIITFIMVVASVVLALILSDRIATPLARLNDGAKRLAKGEYTADFNGKGFLELKELSDTLNTTAEELSKVDSLRRELIANISHDLRTPLSLIYSYAELMQDFPDEITAAQVQTIMAETKRLSSLVDDVMDVSRLETGTMELDMQKYNITESLDATISRAAELLKNEDYHIVFEYTKDAYVIADEVKITQAFYNLLINAVHYCGTDKRITVRQSLTECGTKIEIMDNGEGIAPENLPYIWDRYYKVDKNHRRAVTGTGLGLSIVKKILELHGAQYGVDSEVGKGTRFWFILG